jgi:hypothetical protein
MRNRDIFCDVTQPGGVTPGWSRNRIFELLVCRQSISSQGPSQSHTTTGTTSGTSSPVSAEGSQAVGSGSIGVAGTNARYLESGATDNANADLSSHINAGTGSQVIIGDPNAGQAITALANTVAQTTAGNSGGGGSTILSLPTGTAAAGSINWMQIGLIGAAIAAVFLFLSLFGKRARA